MPIQISIEIIEQARTGQAAGVETLLEAVWPQAYRVARAIVVDAAAAEYVAQESCVSAFRTIASLRCAKAFGGWFYRIVVNEARKHNRFAHRTPPSDIERSYETDMEAHIDLWRAMEVLPLEQRAAIVLYYFEGFARAISLTFCKFRTLPCGFGSYKQAKEDGLILTFYSRHLNQTEAVATPSSRSSNLDGVNGRKLNRREVAI